MVTLLTTLLVILGASCEGVQSNVSSVIKDNAVCTNECKDNDPTYWCGLKRKDQNGKIFQCTQYTSEGVSCITSCQDQSGEKYKWCMTNAVTVRDWWGKCSLPGYTVNKEKCKDSCSKRGEDYYWCKTKSGWDYCSPEGKVKPLQLNRLGSRCNSECAQKDSNYYWCTRNREWCQSKSCDEDWEYCSPDETHTYQGKECVGECKYHRATTGTDYYWCETKSRTTWDYCSPEPKDGVHLSVKPQFDIYGRECRNLCDKHGKDYFWCKNIGGREYWDYCSPTRKTIYNKPCTDSCKRRGKSYYWCHTETGWDYCSPTTRPKNEGTSGKNVGISGKVTQFGAVFFVLSCLNVAFVTHAFI